MNLPFIGNADRYKIHRFYEKLQTNVNALDTIGKLREIKGYVRFTLDKFIEALRKWTERNLLL